MSTIILTINFLLPFVILLIILSNKYVYASDFLKDCQANEQYIECGGCEGTCKEPFVVCFRIKLFKQCFPEN